MKIGYPCINTSILCKNTHTFRLKSYSDDRLAASVKLNLECLKMILEFNVEKHLLFFRISSDLIPLASHPVCKCDWENKFENEFLQIGKIIKENNIRISMHPDQFTLLNSPRESVFNNSLNELNYHCRLLDAMKLDSTAKIQIHIGGVYGDKPVSVDRFIENYKILPERIKKRLVIENDDKSYSLRDCLYINSKTGIPVLFDIFHHQINNNGESLNQCFTSFSKTWNDKDGIPMVDYSQQRPGAKTGSHTYEINIDEFRQCVFKLKKFDYDIMLEIKDKEKSALKALRVIKQFDNFV